MRDVTKALTKTSVESWVRAGHSLEMFHRWKNAVRDMLLLWLEKERVLFNLTQLNLNLTYVETGMTAPSVGNEQTLVFDHVDLEPVSSSSFLLLLSCK